MMLRLHLLHLRSFATGPGLPAAAGMAALISGAALLAVGAPVAYGTPPLLLGVDRGGVPTRRPAAANRVPPPAAAGPVFPIGRAPVPVHGGAL